jgi:hypothetical protein
LLYKWILNYRRNAYRRNALKEIEKIQQNSQDKSLLNGVLVILRLTAIEAYGRKQVANLYGSEWINFLDSKVSKNLFQKYADSISDFVYKGIIAETKEIREIIDSSKKWIKTHA